MFLYADNMMKYAFSKEYTDEIELKNNEPAIVGIPFDSTTSYKSGARYGPKAVRESSYNFELFNFNFNKMLTTTSYDIGDIEVANGNYENSNFMIKDTINSLLELNLKPISIGGEHTITNGVIQAIHDNNPDLFHELTVVILDAHFDMRDTYFGEKYSHATVARRIHELNPKEIVQIGIRSADYDEFNYVKDQSNIKYFTNYDVHDKKDEIIQYIKNINTPIYISVDIDVLDPSYAPSVGTPAPNGISPRDLEDIIKELSLKNNIGLDVVEVSSDTIGDSTSINASKVIYDYLCLQDE